MTLFYFDAFKNNNFCSYNEEYFLYTAIRFPIWKFITSILSKNNRLCLFVCVSA